MYLTGLSQLLVDDCTEKIIGVQILIKYKFEIYICNAAYVYNGKMYQERPSLPEFLQEQKKYNYHNEVMIKDYVPAGKINQVVLGSHKAKNKVIDILRSRGALSSKNGKEYLGDRSIDSLIAV